MLHKKDETLMTKKSMKYNDYKVKLSIFRFKKLLNLLLNDLAIKKKASFQLQEPKRCVKSPHKFCTVVFKVAFFVCNPVYYTK